MAKDTPLSERSAETYFEAVIAAILATAAIGVASPTPENVIQKYKEMLQKLRMSGGAFN
jgi:hypothetical protein